MRICVRALNDVLDEGLPLHPLQEQRESVTNWRQIGLGIMGLADMLIKMEMVYGTKEAMAFCHRLGFIMADTAISESALIAKEKGMFPKCVIDQVLASPYFRENTSEETRELVRQYGLRNSQLLTIAPTGTLSTMLGISGGIEPIFATHFERRTTSLSDHDEYYTVYPPVVKDYIDKHHLKDDTQLPAWFVTAQNLDYKQRLNLQGTWQMHIDASISSTVNLPKDFPEADVYGLYIYAWQIGCKGVTVFRDGCKRLSILTPKEKEEKKKQEAEKKETAVEKAIAPNRGVVKTVADNVIGKKRKLMTGCGSLHCTAFFDPKTGDLMEVYLNKGSTGGCNNFIQDDLPRRQERMRRLLHSGPAQVMRILSLVRRQDLHQEGHQQGVLLPHGGRMGPHRHVRGDAEAGQGVDPHRPSRRSYTQEEGPQPVSQVRRRAHLPGRLQHLQVLRMDQVRVKHKGVMAGGRLPRPYPSLLRNYISEVVRRSVPALLEHDAFLEPAAFLPFPVADAHQFPFGDTEV